MGQRGEREEGIRVKGIRKGKREGDKKNVKSSRGENINMKQILLPTNRDCRKEGRKRECRGRGKGEEGRGSPKRRKDPKREKGILR